MIITNGKVALPNQGDFRDVDLRIEGETIVEIGSKLTGDPERLDADGLWILPGGVDAHVHFDDPGYTDREDFFTGSCAAASGGITTVIDMPCTSIPPVTSVDNLTQKLAAIQNKPVVDYGLYGGVCEQSYGHDFPANMKALSEFVLGYKTYLHSGMDTFRRLNLRQLEQVLRIGREARLPVLVHAEDHDYVQATTEEARQRGHSPRHYYESRPEIAEIIAVLNVLALSEKAGADVHIVHLGTAEAARLLQGHRATGETAPHYLAFDRDDFERMGAPLKVAPALKGPGNKEELWALLAHGVIDFVASDHAPCPAREKETGSVWTDYGGIPGVGTLLPYMVSEGYLQGRLSLQRLLQVTAGRPAERYSLDHRKGSIAVGKDADLVWIDPTAEWIVEGRRFLSKGKITPFEGMRFRGKVMKTMVRGRVVYDCENGILVQPGYGEWLRRQAVC